MYRCDLLSSKIWKNTVISIRAPSVLELTGALSSMHWAGDRIHTGNESRLFLLHDGIHVYRQLRVSSVTKLLFIELW